jgi:hypothetical protein
MDMADLEEFLTECRPVTDIANYLCRTVAEVERKIAALKHWDAPPAPQPANRLIEPCQPSTASKHLIAFDLLELDGRGLIRVPIEERKYQLARLLNEAPAGVRLCSHLEGAGDIVFEHACKLGCEGIVSKRLGSKYRPGPAKSSQTR